MIRLASVSATGRGATDQLLSAVVERLQAEGVRLGGALRRQETQSEASNCNSDLWLLPDGPIVRITQNLGAGSTACRMDAGALEEAVGTATARLVAGNVDLIVLNKFGVSEAEGRGFHALIVEALSRNVPVLTGVSDAHRAAFEHFAGGMATALSPDESEVLAWCLTVVKPAASRIEEA
ncbi:DUF2478 domain-containing protein [Ruegeria atlantica]|uniref:DUF2478 domain-containing protein n=1 Tax=Ruegeria atlantica TaxID=81569 RepID=UPI001C2C405E|nr:DUF2478 domain-containing protein [Ruegeria atlantica]